MATPVTADPQGDYMTMRTDQVSEVMTVKQEMNLFHLLEMKQVVSGDEPIWKDETRWVWLTSDQQDGDVTVSV